MAKMTSEEKKELKKELGAKVLNIARGFEGEHESIRDEHILQTKKGEYFFRGHQRLYYDKFARDYRRFEESPDYDADEDEFNRVVNIYRAHGEAVIAALTIDVPGVNFLPDDTSNSDDIDTANNYSAAALLIQRHNDAEILYAHAAYLAWISPLVAGYHYLDADKKYGVRKEPQFEEREEIQIKWRCARGHEVSEDTDVCPECDSTTIKKEEEVVKRSVLKDYVEVPKERIVIKVKDARHVKVSPYATEQSETPYLIFEYEEHISSARARTGLEINGGSDTYAYERFSRDPQGNELDDANRVTTKCVWLRPEAYYYENKEIGDTLLEDFPDGLYSEFVDDECIEMRNENLDDYWTILRFPSSSHIHSNPIGQPLFDIQEIENDIVNLAVDTMAQAIPETFADPAVLDFAKYGQTKRKPGMVTQAKALAGRSLQEGFFTTRTASLSQEVDRLETKIQQLGQLAVGSFPSIYGGSLQGGSKTYAEYSASRQQALQRLSLIHKALTRWWAKVMSKCVPIYVNSLVQDERYTAQVGPGEYLNLTIQADITKGKIGHVEPSAANSLPMSWGQQRDVVMQLLQLNNDQINAVLFSPENAHLLVRLSGLPDLKIPGNDARTKQFREILQMVSLERDENEAPPDVMESTIQIDPMVDDHPLEAQVCKAWLQSKIGQEMRESNPAIYADVLAHMNQHIAAMNSRMPQGPSGAPENAGPPA